MVVGIYVAIWKLYNTEKCTNEIFDILKFSEILITRISASITMKRSVLMVLFLHK